MDIRIRPARDADLPAIVDIFNQAIRTRMSTGYLSKVSVEDRKAWFSGHSAASYPLLVAEGPTGLLGYISFEPYRLGRGAFKKTAEASLFVHEHHRRQGIGDLLLSSGIAAAKQAGITAVVAIVMGTNTGSIRLLEKHGFCRWGLLPKVGEIDGKLFDHMYFGRHLV